MMAFTDKPSAFLRTLLPWYARDMRFFRPVGDFYDQVAQSAIDAVRLGFPSLTPNDTSLTIIGRERRIPRAPNETPEAYARRLVLWLDLWGLAGLSLGFLYAIQSFIFPGYPRCMVVTRENLWSVLEAGASATLSPFEAMTLLAASGDARYVPLVGASTSPRAQFWQHYADPTNWDWDSASNPERTTNQQDFCLVIDPPHYVVDGEYNGTVDEEIIYGEGRAWGFDEPFGTFQILRELIRLYGRRGAECRGVIFTPAQGTFEPDATAGVDWPDGYWGADAKEVMGTVVATRRSDCRYLLPPF